MSKVRNVMRRGDGGTRTQSATRAALGLLGKVRRQLTPVGAWGKGELYYDDYHIPGTYQPEWHKAGSRCIIGSIGHALGFEDNVYPSGVIPEGSAGRGAVALRLLAETINGEQAGSLLANAESVLYVYNDEVGTTQDLILDLIDRTIEYAERSLT